MHVGCGMPSIARDRTKSLLKLDTFQHHGILLGYIICQAVSSVRSELINKSNHCLTSIKYINMSGRLKLWSLQQLFMPAGNAVYQHFSGVGVGLRSLKTPSLCLILLQRGKRYVDFSVPLAHLSAFILYCFTPGRLFIRLHSKNYILYS